MARSIGRRFGRDDAYYWPGFVDAHVEAAAGLHLSPVGVHHHAVPAVAAKSAGKDTVLTRLKAQIDELTQLLALEKSTKTEHRTSLGDADRRSADGGAPTKASSTSLVDSFTQGRIPTRRPLTGAARSELDNEKQALSRGAVPGRAAQPADRGAAPADRGAQGRASSGGSSATGIQDADRRSRHVASMSRWRSASRSWPATAPTSSDGCARSCRPRGHPHRRRPLRLPVGSAVPDGLGRDQRRRARSRSTSSPTPSASCETEIPPDITWVLRVDGHTDKRADPAPRRFTSNWELRRRAPSRWSST